MSKILIADDEVRITEALRRLLELEGYETAIAHDGESTLQIVAEGGIDAVLLDLDMPRMDGLEALGRMRKDGYDVPVLIVSGRGTIQRAIDAVRLGAHDFIEKPIDDDRLLISLQRALEFSKLTDEVGTLRKDSEPSGPVFESPEMQSIHKTVERVAPTDSGVLITGETGVGKEVIASLIHQHSRRASAPFVRLNCAALPENLAESELFGHVRGAFTGADRERKGRFQLADKGTLFLDEIGELPLSLQPKLLRAIGEGEFEPLGSDATLKSDVRIVAATNRDLKKEIEKGGFREDLYYRLAVIEIGIPPLCKRKKDLIVLAEKFLAECSRTVGRPGLTFSDEARDALASYRWPGNVRELKNIIERLAIVAPEEELTADDVEKALPAGADLASESDSTGLAAAVETEERRQITIALENSQGNVSAAARELGIERSHLYKKMKKLGMRG